MISHRTLASAMLVAFGAIGTPSAAMAARAISIPNDATVTSLSVVPTTGRADVVIRIDGAITLKHFTLTNPDKIVVDITGATLGLPAGEAYDGVARGGITSVRYSQFTKSVVRIVLTLDTAHPYTVTQDGADVRVSVNGADVKFEPWNVGSAPSAPTVPSVVSAVDGRAVASTRRPAPKAEEADHSIDRAIERASAPKPENTESIRYGVSEKPAPQQQSQEPRISQNWENAPIADVLGAFSSFTGRTILPTKNVSGTITASINNLPWDVALREIMNANGYDVTVNPDGVIIIDTFANIAARQATIPLQTVNVRLNYARSAGVAPMVEKRLSRNCSQTISTSSSAAPSPVAPGGATAQGPTPPETNTIQSLSCPVRGAVTADTITNSISITDVPSQLSELERYSRSLDLRQPQVNIKAKIILVDRSVLEGMGLRYDLGSQQQFFNDIVPRTDSLGNPLTTAGQILLGGNTISAIANATLRVPDPALQLVYSTALGNFDFTTFLEALQTNTLLDVQAEPSVTVLNNRQANITAGTQVPIRVIDAGTGGQNASSFPRANVSFQQTGVIITVTPQITANRQVQMKMHVENSDVQFQANDVGAVFPKQSYDGETLVADGETAVVGGLTQTTVSFSRSGLPILVDLPIIGRLFGVTNRTETKRDLLILITPHIIDDGQQPDAGHP